MDTPAPKFATIDNWLAISGMGRRTTYDEIGRKNLKAVKLRGRTLIDVEQGLAWMRSLPPPAVKAPRERQPVAA